MLFLLSGRLPQKKRWTFQLTLTLLCEKQASSRLIDVLSFIHHQGGVVIWYEEIHTNNQRCEQLETPEGSSASDYF